MMSLTLEPIYGSLALVMLAGGLSLAVILLITPPTDSRAHRRWLISLRGIATAAILLAILRPALVRTDNRPADAALIAALDVSQSMTLPDGSGSNRFAAQQTAWRQLAAGILHLDQALDVRLLLYDRQARSVAAAVDAIDQIQPTGELTDLSAAGLAVLQAAQGQPIAGVVIMGDGTQTAPQSIGGTGRIAETLNSLGVPLWTVPIGPAGGQSASRDVAIDALDQELHLFAGNEVEIPFQVVTSGLVGARIPIRLSWIDAEDNVTEVAVRQVSPNQADETVPLSISVTAPAPGTYRLLVAAERQSGELLTTNNSQTAFVDVREGGGRILVLQGSYRYEETYLRRALRRFPDLDLTVRRILANTAPRWPIDLGDLFQPGNFDVYVLGDLDAAALGKDQLAQLAEAIAAGAGLVTLGGYQTYGAGGYAASPLADAIPVLMDDARRRELGLNKDDRQDQLTETVSVVLARRHPITDLGGADPVQTWQQLPLPLGANRWNGPKVAPGVQVLLETAQQQPLLIVGQYGRGRTAALAFDSTWRWWRAGHSEAHRRFWRQLMLWMLAREESGGDQIRIDMDARRFAADDRPEFRAEFQAVTESPPAGNLIADLIDETGQAISLDVTSRNGATAIRGTIPKTTPGLYRLRVGLDSQESAVEPAVMAFQVVDESREMARPMADPVLLQQLAAMTSDHGGGSFAADEMDQLIETIKQRRRKAETPVVAKYRLGDGPFSGWTLFTIFAGTLTAEWFLRRRWGLA